MTTNGKVEMDPEMDRAVRGAGIVTKEMRQFGDRDAGSEKRRVERAIAYADWSAKRFEK